MLVPWEVQALHEHMVNEDHWGQDMLLECEDMPLEGWDEEDDHYFYAEGGVLRWIRPPSIVPCVDISEVRAPPQQEVPTPLALREWGGAAAVVGTC